MDMRAYILWALILTMLIIAKVYNVQDNVEHVPMDTTEHVIGIDISHHQGKINWEEVSHYNGTPLSFIYVKATEGTTYQDPMYQQYFYKAKEYSIPLGSYHYFRTSSPVTSQFNNFVSVAKKEDQELIPMVDIEEAAKWKGKIFRDSLDKFLLLTEDYYGKKPILYTVNSFYNKHLKGYYKDYMFCIGRYGENEPDLFDGHSWTLWQYTDKAHVPGIEKAADIDILNPNQQLLNLKLKPDEGK